MAGKPQISSPANVKFKISQETKLGRNVNIVCRANEDLINQIKNCITNEYVSIGVMHRDKKPTRNDPNKHIGINADSVNVAIRNSLRAIENLSFETNVEYGGFFERNIKSNFDFSFYDRMYNYCQFWNHNCDKADLDNIIASTILARDEESWNAFRGEYDPQPRTLITYHGENDCNIVGEIQMGNWAMIYKDIFRLLRAKNSPGVHLYIYITNTGILEKKLSDGVVTYTKALTELQENLDVIDVPILILGVDIDEYDGDEFLEAHNLAIKKAKMITDKVFTIEEIKNLETHDITIDVMEDLATNYINGEPFENEICRITHLENGNENAYWLIEFIEQNENEE